MKGIIVKYDATRRFGFIRSNKRGSDDIFFHLSDITSGAQQPSAGARVTFQMSNGERGPKAINITIVSQPVSPYLFYLMVGIVIGSAAFLLLRLYAPSLTALADYLLAINIASFVFTGFDKSIAGSSAMRIPETILFGIAIIGGSIGIVAGMKKFRHKTKKASFQFVLFTIILAQIVIAKVSHLSAGDFINRSSYHFR